MLAMKTIVAIAVLCLCACSVKAIPQPVAYVVSDVMTHQAFHDTQGPRSYIVVQMAHGFTPLCTKKKQYGMPFYRSSGANSGLPDTWLPVIGLSCSRRTSGFVLKYEFAVKPQKIAAIDDVIDDIYTKVQHEADQLHAQLVTQYHITTPGGKKVIEELFVRSLYSVDAGLKFDVPSGEIPHKNLIDISCGLGGPLWTSPLGPRLIQELHLNCAPGSIAVPATEVWPFRYDGADLMVAIGKNNFIGIPYVTTNPDNGEPTLAEDSWLVDADTGLVRTDISKCKTPPTFSPKCLPKDATEKNQWETQYQQKVTAAHGNRATTDLPIISRITEKAELPTPSVKEVVAEAVKKKFSQFKKIAKKVIDKLKRSSPTTPPSALGPATS